MIHAWFVLPTLQLLWPVQSRSRRHGGFGMLIPHQTKDQARQKASFLSVLFNMWIIRGYAPNSCLNTILVPRPSTRGAQRRRSPPRKMCWTQLKNFGPLLENSFPHLVSQTGYGPVISHMQKQEWECDWHIKLQTWGSCHIGVKATWTLHFIFHLYFPWNHRQSVWF